MFYVWSTRCGTARTTCSRYKSGGSQSSVYKGDLFCMRGFILLVTESTRSTSLVLRKMRMLRKIELIRGVVKPIEPPLPSICVQNGVGGLFCMRDSF